MKTKILSIFSLLLLVVLATGCTKEEIVFDHEYPQFNLRSDAKLIEVIVPQGTVATDQIYISGVFNGNNDSEAVKDVRWQLEKCRANDIKWGIYIFPEDMQPGTSLADGYHLVSVNQGVERTLLNDTVIHTEDPGVGARATITAQRWKAYFDKPVDPEEIVHDGYAVFVDDQSSWGDIALYAWGSDLPELFGGWPGIKPTGTVTINGVKYKYFDSGEANKGLTYNLILNNNNGGKQFDAPKAWTLDHDIYLRLTDEGITEIGEDEKIVHDGFAIFIADNSGWEALAMYGWASDMPELFGGWPGALPTGEVTIKGVKYKYFDTGEANVGLGYNIILNNNNGGKQFDLAYVTLDRHYYFSSDGTKGVEIDPENPPGPDPGPDPEPEPATEYHIYVKNNTGWDAVALYAWGDAELFGGWPGQVGTAVTVAGTPMLMFTMQGRGETQNLIFNNNNGGVQFDACTITADRDYCFEITSSSCVEIPMPQGDIKKNNKKRK